MNDVPPAFGIAGVDEVEQVDERLGIMFLGGEAEKLAGMHVENGKRSAKSR